MTEEDKQETKEQSAEQEQAAEENRPAKKPLFSKAINMFLYLFAGVFMLSIFAIMVVYYNPNKNNPNPVLERHFELSSKDVTDLKGGGLAWHQYEALLYFKASEFKPLVNMVVYETVECSSIAEVMKSHHLDFAKRYGLDQVVITGDVDDSVYAGVMNQESFICYSPNVDSITKSYLLYDKNSGEHYFYIRA